MTSQLSHQLKIQSLSHDGRGIANSDGKKTFIFGALPNEKVTFQYLKKHNNYDEGMAIEILEPSLDRINPECPHFPICGGCSLQHLKHVKQISFKINMLQEILQHFGDLKDLQMLSPIIGPIYGYRKRARLSVKYVAKKGKVLIGFHERNGRFVADIDSCKVLDPRVGEKIIHLRELITKLSIYQNIPQIEVAIGDTKIALVFRILKECSDQDLILLSQFADEHNFTIYLQSGGVETVKPLKIDEILGDFYVLPKHNIKIFFNPTDFTQVNQEINKLMVDRVIELLDPKPDEKILDLFCGLGNFTLPISYKCKEIIGVEGTLAQVKRAQENAAKNSITNAEFFAADLTKDLPITTWCTAHYEKIVLDPPRTGALEICQKMAKFAAKKIIYVSCNPATLARDAKELVNQGYILNRVGIVDMFPHTSHVETIAEFIKN